MKLYVYEPESKRLVAVITATDSRRCEELAEERYSSEYFAKTYSPAFGTMDGLKENPEANKIYI